MKKSKVVSWVMTMGILQKACDTKIIVLALKASDHFSFVKLCF